jgi:hypothetical protein
MIPLKMFPKIKKKIINLKKRALRLMGFALNFGFLEMHRGAILIDVFCGRGALEQSLKNIS